MINNNEIGRRIFDVRKNSKLTQDEYGKRYDISGPAVFKFEKGKVKPSLELWLRMAKDMGIPEGRAVLLWSREKLPERYREYIDLTTMAREDDAEYGSKKKFDYTTARDTKAVKKMVAEDPALPAGIRELMEDQEIVSLFKPTGQEIHLLKKIFGTIGGSSKELYVKALWLLREFLRQ